PTEEPEQSAPSEPASEPVGETPPGTSARGSVQELSALIESDRETVNAMYSRWASTHLSAIACEQAVLRALEIAGGRLATHADRRGRYAGTPKWELHVRTGGVERERADRALEGALNHVPLLAKRLGADPVELEDCLHRYCSTLIEHGIA